MPSKRGSILMEDLAAVDAIIAAGNRTGLGGPPIPEVRRVDGQGASGTAMTSDPAEPTLSDVFRTASPNRQRSNDEPRMRHRRVRRKR